MRDSKDVVIRFTPLTSVPSHAAQGNLIGRGWLHIYESERFEEAMKQFEFAINMSPDNLPAHLGT